MTAPIVVGYLATDSGKAGLALGADLASQLGAPLHIVTVVPHEFPAIAPVPTEAGFPEIVDAQANRWLEAAAATVPSAVAVTTAVLTAESFTAALLDYVAARGAQLLTIGAASDGVSIGVLSELGPITREILHAATIPVALAPRHYGLAGGERTTAKPIDRVVSAIGTRPGAPRLLAESLDLAQRLDVPLQLMSLVSIDDGTGPDARAAAIAHADWMHTEARSALPSGFSVDSFVAEGNSIESASRKLRWEEGDLLVVGSSRLAAPRRLFLGSTAARLLKVTPVPVIVVPSEGNDEPSSNPPADSNGPTPEAEQS